jgi:hypothetical protein
MAALMGKLATAFVLVYLEKVRYSILLTLVPIPDLENSY